MDQCRYHRDALRLHWGMAGAGQAKLHRLFGAPAKPKQDKGAAAPRNRGEHGRYGVSNIPPPLHVPTPQGEQRSNPPPAGPRQQQRKGPWSPHVILALPRTAWPLQPPRPARSCPNGFQVLKTAPRRRPVPCAAATLTGFQSSRVPRREHDPKGSKIGAPRHQPGRRRKTSGAAGPQAAISGHAGSAHAKRTMASRGMQCLHRGRHT
mmetsp:Transcript_62823/g.159048  ORF Transcript_62823/g.159048 Transcript_62823/m.159048 type:complete len:207 (-) Transcript_62823:1077-1697(-)